MKKCILLLIGLCVSSSLLPDEALARLAREFQALKREVSDTLKDEVSDDLKKKTRLYKYLRANPYNLFLSQKKKVFDDLIAGLESRIDEIQPGSSSVSDGSRMKLWNQKKSVLSLRGQVEEEGRIWSKSIDPYRELLMELKKRYDFLSQPAEKILQDLDNQEVDILFGGKDSFCNKLNEMRRLFVKQIQAKKEDEHQIYRRAGCSAEASHRYMKRLNEADTVAAQNRLIRDLAEDLIELLPQPPENFGFLLARELEPFRTQEAVENALSLEYRYLLSRRTLLFLRAKILQNQLSDSEAWQRHFDRGLEGIDSSLVQKLYLFLGSSPGGNKWDSDEGLKQLLGMNDPADENDPEPIAADTLLAFVKELLSSARFQEQVDALAKKYEITPQQLRALTQKEDKKGERWSFLLQNWDIKKNPLEKEKDSLERAIAQAARKLLGARRINRGKPTNDEVAKMYELIDPNHSRMSLNSREGRSPEDKAALLGRVSDIPVGNLRNELKRREAGIYNRRTKVGASVGSGATAAFLLTWLLSRIAYNNKRGSLGSLVGLAPEKVLRAQVEAILRKKADEGTLGAALVVQAQQELKKLRRLQIARRASGVLALLSGLGTAIGTGWRVMQRPRYRDYDIQP